MLKNYFNDDKLFESVYNEGKCGAPSGHCGANKLTCGGGSGCGLVESNRRFHEDCGSSSGCGRSEENNSSCGGSGCGFRESRKFHECGSSYDTRSTYGCGSLGYSCSCEIGRRVRIGVGEGCGAHIEVGRLLGYAE